MCLGLAATAGMAAVGTVATAVALRRAAPPAVPLTLAYFTLMEMLQLWGYAVADQCLSPQNQLVALLSYLHIVFQPFFINAFTLTLVRGRVPPTLVGGVYLACGFSAAVMLVQLYPFAWAIPCQIGRSLCADGLCVVSGAWHIGWNVSYNGLLEPFTHGFGGGFPTYMLAAFGLPLLYGAWRFVLMHAVAGPLLAMAVTDSPNEMPAAWCLFSIGILLIALSPPLRRRVETPGWVVSQRSTPA